RQHRRAIWTTNLGKKSGRERKKVLAKTWGVRPGRSFRGPSRAAAVKDGARLRDPPRQRRAASLTAASTTAGCVGLGRHTSHRWFANRAPLLVAASQSRLGLTLRVTRPVAASDENPRRARHWCCADRAPQPCIRSIGLRIAP